MAFPPLSRSKGATRFFSTTQWGRPPATRRPADALIDRQRDSEDKRCVANKMHLPSDYIRTHTHPHIRKLLGWPFTPIFVYLVFPFFFFLITCTPLNSSVLNTAYFSPFFLVISTFKIRPHKQTQQHKKKKKHLRAAKPCKRISVRASGKIN